MAKRTSAQLTVSLERLLNLYFSHCRSRRLSDQTVKFYETRLSHLVAWLREELQAEPTLAHFTTANFTMFILEKQEEVLYSSHPNHPTKDAKPSSAYIHGYFRTVRAFGGFLARQDFSQENPMRKLELPKLEEKQLRPLTEEEEKRLLEAYDENSSVGCRLKAILMLMLDAGLRRAELVDLKLADVHMEDGFLLIKGKGSKERWIPFGFKTGWVLQRYVSIYRPGPALPTIDNLFLDAEGNPMTPGSMNQMFKRIGKKTKIDRLHPHLLRHTFGIRSEEMNIPSLTLQRYMGHSDVRTTQRYAHAAQSEKIKRERGFSHLDKMPIKVKKGRNGK